MNRNALADDLTGLNQLSHEGFMGVAEITESLHQNILSFGGLLNKNQRSDRFYLPQCSFCGKHWFSKRRVDHSSVITTYARRVGESAAFTLVVDAQWRLGRSFTGQ
jgi:hypothetical protein